MEQEKTRAAPVGGRYRVDGELASFFTAADEQFMVRRTLSRLVEMCGEEAAASAAAAAQPSDER